MANKRATLPRTFEFTREFLKDWERFDRTGRFNMKQLKAVMMLLVANDSPLGPEWKDHPLRGNWTGYRECHVGGDFLLVYQLDETVGRSGMVVFNRIGTHSELFD